MQGVIACLAGERDAEPAWMDVIAVTALATPVHKAGPFEVSHEFTELSGHGSIKTISHSIASRISQPCMRPKIASLIRANPRDPRDTQLRSRKLPNCSPLYPEGTRSGRPCGAVPAARPFASRLAHGAPASGRPPLRCGPCLQHDHLRLRLRPRCRAPSGSNILRLVRPFTRLISLDHEMSQIRGQRAVDTSAPPSRPSGRRGSHRCGGLSRPASSPSRSGG